VADPVPSILSDGQVAVLASAIVSGFSLLAWAVKSGFGRYEEAFKAMTEAFKGLVGELKALATEHAQMKTSLVKLEGTVNEGRDDIHEIRALAERHLAPTPPPKPRRSESRMTPPTGTRRASTARGED
jgi:hypothetical protein